MTRVVLMFGLCVIAPFVLADSQDGTGPQALAVSFMAQFYQVKADSITTSVEDFGNEAVVIAETTQGNRCRFELAKAPAYVKAPTGWLASGMRCESV